MLELVNKHVLVLDSAEEAESIQASAKVLPLLREMITSIESGMISDEEVDLGSIYYNLVTLKSLKPITIKVFSEKSVYFIIHCITPKIASQLFEELKYEYSTNDSGDRYVEMSQEGVVLDYKKISIASAQRLWNKYRTTGLYIKKL